MHLAGERRCVFSVMTSNVWMCWEYWVDGISLRSIIETLESVKQRPIEEKLPRKGFVLT